MLIMIIMVIIVAIIIVYYDCNCVNDSNNNSGAGGVGDNNNCNNNNNNNNNQNDLGIMCFGILVIFLFNLTLPMKFFVIFSYNSFFSIVLLNKYYSISIYSFNFHFSCIFLLGPYSLNFFFFFNPFIKFLLVFYLPFQSGELCFFIFPHSFYFFLLELFFFN